MAKNEYFYGLGRRKAATARARLFGGKGEITINGKSADEYLSGNKTMIAELTDRSLLSASKRNLMYHSLLAAVAWPVRLTQPSSLSLRRSAS